jgi:ABC-2 type transport system permease protein
MSGTRGMYDIRYTPEALQNFKDFPLIFRSSYFVFPMLLAIFVPTVCALLIYRYVHSKKASVFTHSIPVTRCENFVSSSLAGLTLMWVPIILNGLILMIVQGCGFENLYTINSCFIWIILNMFFTFIMFSVAAFSAMLTGNSIAAFVINVLIHASSFIIAGSFYTLSEVFIYGFSLDNIFFETLFNNNFACVAFSFGSSFQHYSGNMTLLKYIIFTLIALVFFFGAYLLYKKRNLENAEDVAGFKCLNAIFKYFLVFLVTIGAFSLGWYNITDSSTAFVITLILVSIVTYFGCEMVLKKTLKVLKSYKGYLGFALTFSLLVSFFAFTGFFGYETRLPKRDEIKLVSVTDHRSASYDKIPVTEDDKLIDYILSTHENLVEKENIYTVIPDSNYSYYTLSYTLENGRKLERKYRLSNTLLREFMTEIYKNDEYKMQCEDIFIPYSSVSHINVYATDDKLIIKNDIPQEKYEELINVIKNETLRLTYNELHPEYTAKVNHMLSMEFRIVREEEDLKSDVTYHRVPYITFTKDYKDTIKWLYDNNIIEDAAL